MHLCIFCSTAELDYTLDGNAPITPRRGLVAPRVALATRVYSPRSQPSFFSTSSALRCVNSSFSSNISLKRVRMPAGGPPSMIFFSPSGISIDMSCSREGGLDNAMYVANQRSSSEKNRGYFQWKLSPGLAVVPCSVWMVLAVRTVTGSCNLLTRSV